MRRLIGIEPEVIQCAEADRIRVWVLSHCFAVPRYRIADLRNSPWRTTVTLVVKGAVVCPAWFLRWRMKVDIAYVDSGSQWHTERLNSPIEVHVVEGVVIMPHSSLWVGHFVSHEPDAIISWIGLHLINCRAGSRPGHDGRLHPERRTDCVKTKGRIGASD